MATLIDFEYYEWLVRQIDTHNGKSYSELFEKMHNLEYVWTVQGDDSRVNDGLELREEFLALGPQTDKLDLGAATFLEVLVALSRRVSFISGGQLDPPQWAWQLIKNLRLHTAHDPIRNHKGVDETLNTVIWRGYRPDGVGGFFPLQNPTKDQTEVEIWYQMNAYVNELSDI